MKIHVHALLGVSAAMIGLTSAQSSSSDVIIIGAGPSGMSAAQTLLSRDPSTTITILEATNRYGGRVRSTTLGDTRVELGAEEHYGADGNNPVHAALTEAYPGIYREAFEGSKVYAMPPDPIGGASVDQGNPAGTCGSVTYGQGGALARNCADDAAWGTYIGIWDWYWKPSRFQKNPSQTTEEALAADRAFFKNVANYEGTRGWFAYNSEYGAEWATTTDKMGAHDIAVADFEWPLSETVSYNTNNLGYSDLLNETWWRDTINSPSVTIELDSPVTSITAPGSSDPVEVVVGGTTYTADHVIVTVPIGVLKASVGQVSGVSPGDLGHISFSPALPDATTQAIADIGVDQGLKAALKFDRSLPDCGTAEPWWNAAVGGEVGYLITNGVSGGWAWGANYKDGSSDDVLMTFIMGDAASALSQIPDDAAIAQIVSDLDDMFPGAKASDCFENDPENYVIQNWGQEPYWRGAYSFNGPATIDDDGDADVNNARERLRAPVYDGRVLFAGEATSFTTYATVPGAIFEGERAGNAIPLSNGPRTTTTTGATTTTTGATGSTTGGTTTGTTTTTTTTTAGSSCASIARAKTCRATGGCAWSQGSCVPDTASAGSCGSFGSNNDCRGDDGCEWFRGECVAKGNGNPWGGNPFTRRMNVVEAGAPSLRAGGGRRMQGNGNNKVIDDRGEKMIKAAKGGKSAGPKSVEP